MPPLEPSAASARERVGQFVRSTHGYGFRSGAWALIRDYSEDAEGPCWLVEFRDGVTDWWRVDDMFGNYEFRSSYTTEDYERDKKARERRGAT